MATNREEHRPGLIVEATTRILGWLALAAVVYVALKGSLPKYLSYRGPDMPLAAILLGAILIDLAFRGTEHEFAAQLGQDFGQGSQFIAWAAAIVILGAIGYVKPLDKVSTGLLALVILVMVIRNGGLFAQLEFGHHASAGRGARSPCPNMAEAAPATPAAPAARAAAPPCRK